MGMEFLIGGMLGRVVAPIAQDVFETKTQLGREIAERKFEKQHRISMMEYENKLALNKHSHEDKLVEMQKQFELNLQKAEHQMQLQHSEWEKETFWKYCFPLRNPYEVGGMIQGKDMRIGTIMLPNNRQIVPLRVISALKDSTNDISSTLNANMSLFLANHFSANGEHAIISDIGAWKEDAPVNDASVNYLYKGLKGQPTLVLVPIFTDSGSVVKLKMWSWGLGEDLQYPIGFNLGWFDVDTIRRQAQIEQLRGFYSILEKAGIEYPNEVLKKNFSIIRMIDKKSDNLSQGDIDYLYSVLVGPIKEEEIIKRAKQRTNEIVSSILSCTTAMYGDAYHLSNYGIKPLLPYILPQLHITKEFLPVIRDYYVTLINTGMIEGILTKEQAVELELDLAEGLRLTNACSQIIDSVCDDIRLLNEDITGEAHKKAVVRLRQFKDINKINSLPQ